MISVITLCLCRLCGPRRAKTCLQSSANNKGTDQPGHPHRLISAFFIRFLECIISKLATCDISIFQLVSVAEEADLSFTLWETPKIGFVATRLNFFYNILYSRQPKVTVTS